MALPLTPAALLALYEKRGLNIHENDGWRKHDRAGHGSWGPINGVMIHHTGDDATDDADYRVLWNGRSDLPGPLCHVGIRDTGVIELISGGRANHAGGGDPFVLAQVTTEEYLTEPRAPRYHNGQRGAADGNAHFYGAELMYSGAHRPTDACYRSAVLWAAALCVNYGWTAKSVIAHREWSNWKQDPGSISMPQMRRDITLAMKGMQ